MQGMEHIRQAKMTVIIFILSICFLACNNKIKSEVNVLDSTSVKKDTINCKEEKSKLDTFPKINYSRVYIDNSKKLSSILSKYSKSANNKAYLKALATLNRKELRYIRLRDTVLVPDSVFADMRAYSVFPFFYCGAKDLKKLVVVSNKLQCYACYEYGKLVRFAAANTGKERTPTYPGRYSFVWKERLRKSSLDETWIMPFTWNFHQLSGSAFHQFTMPGHPVSHSCVRQFLDDAEWLFNWGEGYKKDSLGRFIHLSGVPVIIIDIYDFSKKNYRPWLEHNSNKERDYVKEVKLENPTIKHLASFKDKIITLPDKPMDVDEALIPWSQIPDMSKSAIAKKKFFYAEDSLRSWGIIREGVTIQKSIDFNKIRKQKEAEKTKKGKI